MAKLIKERYTVPANLDRLVREVQKELSSQADTSARDLKVLQSRLHDAQKQKKMIVDAVKMGANPEFYRDETFDLQAKIENIQKEINDLQSRPERTKAHSAAEIREFVTTVATQFDSIDVDDRKRLVRTFVHRLRLKNNREVQVEFFPDFTVHSICVGSGT